MLTAVGQTPDGSKKNTFTHKLYVDVLMNLITVVGLTPCGSKTVHI